MTVTAIRLHEACANKCLQYELAQETLEHDQKRRLGPVLTGLLYLFELDCCTSSSEPIHHGTIY